MRKHSKDWQLVALLTGYLIASVSYAVLIPWGENPDETVHYQYIEYLDLHWRLPVFSSSEVNYEAHQPPLYYALALPFFWLSGLIGTPKAIRLLAVLTGGGMVVSTYLTARKVCPREEGIAVLSGAIAAFLPSQLTVNSSVSNDAQAAFLFSLFSLWASGLWGKKVRAREGLLIGTLLGVGMLTKLTCAILVLLAPIGILLASQKRGGSREPAQGREGKKAKQKVETKLRAYEQGSARAREGERPLLALAVAGGTALFISGWWLLRNQLLYGDPTAWKAFVAVFSRDRPTPEYFLSQGFSYATYFGVVFLYTFKTFWGCFAQAGVREGYVFLPGWIYSIWFGVCGCVVLGWVKRGWERRQKETEAPELRLVRWVLLLQVALLFAFFLRFNIVFFQPQARYLLTAATPIALFLALGLLGLFPQRSRKAAGRVSAALFFAYSMAAFLIWALPHYSGR